MGAYVRRVLVATLVAVVLTSLPAAPPATEASSQNYLNPLTVRIPGNGLVETCADPTLIRGQQSGDTRWYMYCTMDPLNEADRDEAGNLRFRMIPMLSSTDLVNWTYEGDAFTERPTYATANSGLWAPEIQFFNDRYYLYYTVTETTLPGGGSAIGVATSDGPLGPWTHHDSPVIEPHPADCCPDSRRWVYDPDVIEHNGQRYMYYGSYFGGISVRALSADGLSTAPGSQTNVAISNRYEGAELVWRNGYWYMFVSATDCCRGELTGYSVFVGRSESPLGPFVDRDGQSFMDGRVGGTPVLTMNGNRWVGTGHNTVFQDLDGQWWTAYHAIDRNDPWIEGPPFRVPKRPVLLDPIDWIGGWPTVRGGQWASDEPMKRPAAQPGQVSRYRTFGPVGHTARQVLYQDDFSGNSLGAEWSWVREPSSTTWSVGGGVLRWDTQNADLFEDNNSASVLTRDLPEGNWMIETRMRLNLPPEGCCFNYTQAGLLVYGDDDAYLKLVHVSIWETRQTEWAKEIPTPIVTGQRYGNTVVAAPNEWTWFRIASWTRGGERLYQAYTSRDGQTWTRGGVWTHDLDDPSVGLVSMGGAGFTAEFDYVRVYRLQVTGSQPTR